MKRELLTFVLLAGLWGALSGCSRPASSCDPSRCFGCCQNGICQSGNEPASCGSGGADCKFCSAGQACSQGLCVPVSSGSGSDGGTDGGSSVVDHGGCAGTLIRCGGKCVDPTTSTVHCGACNVACAPGEVCDKTGCATLPADCHAAGGCAPGFYCDAVDLHCKPGCAVDIECPQPGTCDSLLHKCSCATTSHLCGWQCMYDQDPASCGSSCEACPTVPNGMATCTSATCGFSCNIGFHPVTGACLPNDTIDCCGTACLKCSPSLGLNSVATCDGTSCGSACAPGLHLCSGQCVSDYSVNSCGTSCVPCSPPNTWTTCMGGQCGATWTCSSGYADCDGIASTGCEINTQIDSKNCGGCGHDCLGGACQAGQCQPVVLASGQSSPRGVAVDASAVYWTNYTIAGTVMKVSLGGGIPVTLASGQSSPLDIAVDASAVYWTNNSSAGTVMTVPLGGGSPVTLASGQSWPAEIAVDASAVYWTSSGATVMKVALGGGTLVTLASGQSSPWGIAVDASAVYWTKFARLGAVMTVPLGGGTPVTLASGPYPEGIAVDASGVYWTNAASISLPGTVTKVALGGGTPVTLASGQNTPHGIAVDASAVYWTDSTNGTVMKIAK